VTIELNNQGEDPHNLNLMREGSGGEPMVLPETDSEERSVEDFDLPAGKYKLWCSLPEHEEQGMTATLQVG
jgi:Copper binding proteins, plastocyanin/azurin family